MKDFAFTFPLLFIFHDLEEIIGMKFFLDRNRETLKQRFPFVYNRFKNFSTEGFALAVMEEFVVFTLIALAALWFDNQLFWNIWLGGFLGLTFHYVVHIGQAVVLRKYIPALTTSIICLPVSVFILYRCFNELLGSLSENMLEIILGAVIVAVNLFFAQKLTGIFGR